MKNLGYLECEKGGFHSGEFLNIVCLEAACNDNPLCCCSCVEQHHQGHKTKTLKKLLIDSDTLAKAYKEPVQSAKSLEKINLNTDILVNLVQNEQKDIIHKLHALKKQFAKQMDELQNGIHTYYKKLHHEINHPNSSEKDLKVQLASSIENVQGAGNFQALRENVKKLIKNLEIYERSVGKSGAEFQKPDQESYLNFLNNSNKDINEMVNKKIETLLNRLVKQNQRLRGMNQKINDFWNSQLYKFSNIMHHQKVDVINPFVVRANIDSVYQMALMNPALTFANDVECFTFRINHNDLEWVAVGVCYKKIAEKNNFEFKFNQEGHGCYMVSGNAGAWSHSDLDYNNVVKAFTFKPGDSVTCLVQKNKIAFIKNVPSQFEDSLQFSQREYYELQIKPDDKDVLHPCVVSFYQNTEVEYLPSFKTQFRASDLPIYKYKFSKSTKHPDTIIANDTHLLGCYPTNYKCCVLDNPMEGNQAKSVTFRIVKSTGSWIGLGLCHKNIVISKMYDFAFQSIGHGCYMISANGGSWSHIDTGANNIVRTFKFVDGDLVTVSLDEENKMIHFKRGIDSYELPYQPIPGDKLYPVVVLYYEQDEVDVLPEFK